ncbi:PREDICTED: uncharacterized protein LOC109590252, partial [Amphimedon queenslandica]|uniref:Uncharacterized protein n=1 Tax=Amphimedon queenslandica TaxID=400682 RepID=A0AAN0JXU4_AMPQE
MFESAEAEKEIVDTLIGLNNEFSYLMMHARLGLEKKTKNDPYILHSLIIWLEAYMHWNDKLTNASLDETFKIIHPYYDFIDCRLIVDMSQIFLKGFKFGDDKLSIVSEFKKYKEKADKLRFSSEADPNVQTNDGATAFMLACQNGHTQIVELLKQVDPNVQRNDGANAFMLACQNGHTQIVELLLKEQVDPNVQDKDGDTALMAASDEGHYEVVKLLLEWKADPTIKSNGGYT